MQYDTIIIGLGAMGSSAAFHLARKGNQILGLDRFQPPHAFGSSHGKTRIIREAYFEDPCYVPLVQRAYELWDALEKESGHLLFQQTGGLMIGPPGGALVSGALRSARQHMLRHEVLSAAELRSRFPQFQIDDDTVAVREPRAGILFPEKIVETHLELAAKHGATLKFNEPVQNWQIEPEGVRVTTDKDTYRGNHLLLTAGAWLSELLNSMSPGASSNHGDAKAKLEFDLPLTIERQILFWFGSVRRPQLFRPNRFPIFIWEYEQDKFFYGFPDLGEGVKVAFHHQGAVTQPENLRREVSQDEVEAMRVLLRRLLPDAAGDLKSNAVCMYTNTPDEHFVLDFHPAHSQVLVASPCSGHGFKFSSVIGELAANFLGGQPVSYDLKRFEIKRFDSSRLKNSRPR